MQSFETEQPRSRACRYLSYNKMPKYSNGRNAPNPLDKVTEIERRTEVKLRCENGERGPDAASIWNLNIERFSYLLLIIVLRRHGNWTFHPRDVSAFVWTIHPVNGE